MAFLLGLFALGAVGVIAAVAVALVIAQRNKAAFERDSRLAPGLSTSAPAAWAGSHDPEARLHRRLRDAIAALTANQSFDYDGALLDLRVELEQQAVALDEQLVATAALPLHVRSDPLTRIAGAVESLEQSVADLAGSSAAEAAARLNTALEDIRTRTGLVAQARAALDAMPTPDPETVPGSPAPAPPSPAPGNADDDPATGTTGTTGSF